MHSPYEMPISDPGLPRKCPGKRSDELNPWALRRGWRISFLCPRLQPSLKCSQETPASRKGQPEPPHSHRMAGHSRGRGLRPLTGAS